MAETGHVAPLMRPTEMVVPTPAWSCSLRFLDKEEKTSFGPSEVLLCGMNSGVECPACSCVFTHPQEPKEPESQGMQPSPSGGQSPATVASGPGWRW